MNITIITIVYNDFAHIEDTIKSILSQSARRDIEYIVIDGASNDGTTEIIKRYRNLIDKVIIEPDDGIYNAMNKGLKIASGDYILYINCGDRLSDKDVIQSVIRAIADTAPDVVYGSYREFKGGYNTSKIIPCRSYEKIWYGPVASHQSTLYRLGHIKKFRLQYDESYRIAADYKFTAQAIKNASNVLKTDICISDFDISGVSSTNQNLGLKEANRVRMEVFNWGKVKIYGLTVVLLGARYMKKFAYPIYSFLRNI